MQDIWQAIFGHIEYGSHKQCILINKDCHKATLNVIKQLPETITLKIKTNYPTLHKCYKCKSIACKCEFSHGSICAEDQYIETQKKQNHERQCILYDGKIITIHRNDILISKNLWYPMWGLMTVGITIPIKELFDYKQNYNTIMLGNDVLRSRYLYYFAKN